MKQKSYDTVTEAMTDLKKLGYTIDFSILTDEECLVCHLTGTVLSPDDFEIDDFYRFEGDSDPGDEMIVYAISSKNKNLKGIVVNAFGIYADNASSAIVKKLNNHKDSYMLIQDFMIHNIDGIKLKEGIVTDCPNCSDELNKNED